MKQAEFLKIDRLALAFAREGKERSNALPARAYRDPAETVEFEAEVERKEKARKVLAMKLKQGVTNE